MRSLHVHGYEEQVEYVVVASFKRSAHKGLYFGYRTVFTRLCTVLFQDEAYVRTGNGSQAPALTVHRVSLLERKKYERALFKRMPFSTVAYVIFWKVLDDARARAAAIRLESFVCLHSKLSF